MNKTLLVLVLSLMLLQACNNDDAAQAPSVVETDVASSAATEVVISDVTPVASATTDTKFQDLQGNPLDLDAYAGKKVFVNYWATWCAPCIREIPAIGRAAEILESENYVFLLASDESLDVISDFIADREFTGNFIKLNGFFGGHGIDAVPSSVLYDENGEQLRVWLGEFEWDSPEMLAELRGE